MNSTTRRPRINSKMRSQPRGLRGAEELMFASAIKKFSVDYRTPAERAKDNGEPHRPHFDSNITQVRALSYQRVPTAGRSCKVSPCAHSSGRPCPAWMFVLRDTALRKLLVIKQGRVNWQGR